MSANLLEFSPLTVDQLTDRYRSEAMLSVGALVGWAEPVPGDAAPTVALEHARLCVEYLDAAVARSGRVDEVAP